MESADTLGLIAGTLTTVAFFPQVLKTWKSRSAKDISFGMFALFSVGVFFWIIYGFVIGATPVIVANGVTFVLAMAIVAFKLRFKD